MKNRIRKEMKELRKSLSREEVHQKSRAASTFFLESEIYRNSKVLMVYLPLGNEADTGLIIQRAFCDGKTLVLPITDEQTGVITPVHFRADAEFQKGGFSVREPINPQRIDPSRIDTVLVPGIAFAQNGSRIGFGKGCYDMLLEGMTATKVGFCYDFQLCDNIPTDAHDIKMDFIVTEKGIFKT